MRILVTNDDGVSAPGLKVAEDIAHVIAGEDGEVWVAAPAFEQSGVSHAITFTSPIKIERLEERRFAVGGAPADCVILAFHSFMADTPPDLVISGVNRGRNLAEDAVYSGTVGGAIEGVLQGAKAIAFSQFFRRPPQDSSDWEMFAAAKAHGVAVARKILASEQTPDVFFNVNFPPVAADEVKGVRACAQGRRRGGPFTCEERMSPGGRSYYWLRGAGNMPTAAPESDIALCADGYVTVTPMRPDYTAFDRLDALSALNDG